MRSPVQVALLFTVSVSMAARGAAQSPTPIAHAQRLVEAMQMREIWQSSESTYISSLVRLHPNLTRYQDVLEAWQLEVFGWDSVSVGVSRRLAAALSVPELDSLTRFYESPLGRKWRGVAKVLQREMAETAAQLVHDHYPELRARLQVRAQELHQRDPLASD